MKIKILKIQKSGLPIWNTGLSNQGQVTHPLSDMFIDDLNMSGGYSCEMVVNMFESEESVIPSNTIIIGEDQYEFIIKKYGMEALLRGVEILSLLDIKEETKPSGDDQLKREIEAIAYSIVARMEKDTFFNHYNPNSMREYIENKISTLKTKFKIEPK